MEQSKTRSVTGGVLDPITLEAFFKEYWEQKPLYIERESTNPFSRLVSAEKIEALLSTNNLSSQFVQLSHAGKRIAIDDYTDDTGQIVANRIVEGYRKGSTIVISQAQRLVPELMGLCRDIQKSIMMRCQTNLYLSPPGNQGFNPHYDTHDVFILQVSGSKEFNFYAGRADHPTSADRFDKDIHAVGEKTETIKLSAGDTLYIPRGVVHDAVADASAPSLHITLGVYPILLHTLLDEVLKEAFATDSRLRRSISQPLWMQGQEVAVTTQLLRDVVSDSMQEHIVSDALLRLRDEIALDGIKDVKGALTHRSANADKHTVNHSSILHLERAEKSVILRTFGQVLEFPDPLGQAVEWIVDREHFSQSDIKGLEPEQQLSLVLTLQSVDILSAD